jgi:hypothetical protein
MLLKFIVTSSSNVNVIIKTEIWRVFLKTMLTKSQLITC